MDNTSRKSLKTQSIMFSVVMLCFLKCREQVWWCYEEPTLCLLWSMLQYNCRETGLCLWNKRGFGLSLWKWDAQYQSNHSGIYVGC